MHMEWVICKHEMKQFETISIFFCKFEHAISKSQILVSLSNCSMCFNKLKNDYSYSPHFKIQKRIVVMFNFSDRDSNSSKSYVTVVQ